MASWMRPGIGTDDSRRAVHVGTRGSALARAQTEAVIETIQLRYPNVPLQLRVVRTTGDERTDVPLYEIGGKGLFVKELDVALLRDQVQMAVHSLKDLPAGLADGLMLGAVPKREDARDAWIHRDGTPLAESPAGTRVGTSSLRRAAIVRALRPDLEIVPLRGNLDSRLEKLRADGDVDAIIVAAAGLNRLGYGNQATELLDPEVFVPAVGQGCLAVVIRAGDTNRRTFCAGLNDPAARVAAEAERAFLEELEGDCRIPLGGHAVLDDNYIQMTGLLATPDGATVIRRTRRGFTSMCDTVGRELAQELLDAGGREILDALKGG